MKRAIAATLVAGVVLAADIAPIAGARAPRVPHLRSVDPRIAVEGAKGVRAAKRQRRQRQETAPSVAIPPQLSAIAACESHGDPRAIGGGGLYRGLFQMTYTAWRSVGGTGDPAAASPAEQYRRAALLYARAGASQWPVCGG